MTIADANAAKREVEANGREVTFRRLNNSASDPAKPWRGNTSPRATASTEPVFGVFVPPSGITQLGRSSVPDELLRRTEQVAIVAPGADFTENIEDFDEIVDTDGSVWRILNVEVLSPADVRILYYVFVRR